MAGTLVTGAPLTPVLRPRPFFYLLVLFVTLSCFSYGYGISELNALQGAMTCYGGKGLEGHDTVDCLPLSDTQFGLVTALFTVGGFIGSAVLPLIQRRLGLGLRGSIFCALTLNALGNTLIAAARSGTIAGLGRLVTGFGSGVSLVAVPVYLNDIAPPSIQGSIGVLNQLGNVIGVFVAQSAGVALASKAVKPGGSPSVWRFVPLISAGLSIFQLVWGLLIAVDGPLSMENSGVPDARIKADAIRQQLWETGWDGYSAASQVEAHPAAAQSTSTSIAAASQPEASTERQPLIPPEPSDNNGTFSQPEEPYPDPITAKDLFTHPRLRTGMWMIVATQVGQQLGGVNAVLYYSTGIVKGLFKGHEKADNIASAVSVGITVVNALMTLPPIFLVSERLFGRKKLLLLSTGVSMLASFVLGLGIELQLSGILATAALILFVTGFAVGLGPVPFLIMPELVPPQAANVAGSVGLSINWLSNILLASSFLPVRSALSYFDGGKDGLVFWIFTAINLTTFKIVRKYYSYSGPE